MIKSISLTDFRNYKNKTLHFEGKNVVFYGENGKGKTNILEAISLLSVGKSWRESSPLDLIRTGETSALISAQTSDGDQYKVTIQPRSRSFERNEKKQTLKKYFGRIPTLLFVPEYLHLFSGPKRDRQKFFDRFLFQISPQYREDLTLCNKAVKQKNALLKEFPQDRSQGLERPVLERELDPWDEILSAVIPRIAKERMDLLEKITPLLTKCLEDISGESDEIALKLEIKENCTMTPEAVRDFFLLQRSREIAAQKCLLGPHRDDFEFLFREKPLSTNASRGETRSILLALLSAQKEIFLQILGKQPLLLLDDVFSELDQSRQDALENLCDGSQIFFTTTHEEHFQNFSHQVQKIEIE